MTDHKQFWKDAIGQDVAVDEIVLYFNNNTLLYGHKAVDGKPRSEWLDALQAAGFDESFAKLMKSELIRRA